MKTSINWIPVIAVVSTLSLQAQQDSSGATRGGEEKKVLALSAAKSAPDPVSESVVLEHILEKHGEALSEVEKSALSAAVSRLEHDPKEDRGEMCSDLGVWVAPLDEATRRLIQPEVEGGLMVTGEEAGGVLSFWGVGQHDLIVATNGKAIHNAQALQDVLEGAIEANEAVLLDVIVQGNRRTINLLPLRNLEKLKPGAPRFWQMRGC